MYELATNQIVKTVGVNYSLLVQLYASHMARQFDSDFIDVQICILCLGYM